MKDLLIHTTDVRVDVLKPAPVAGDEPCICFSLNIFIAHFGQYVYLFDKAEMRRCFRVERRPSRGVEIAMFISRGSYEDAIGFRGQDLGDEYRIYEPIDVDEHCIAVIKNFNHMKGVLERRFKDKVTKEAIDFSYEI